MIDMHSHILPNMDDGCKDIDETLAVIKTMIKNGIHTICATPHYYREDESIDEFLLRRQQRAEELKSALRQANIHDVRIILGAETKFFPGMSNKALYKLCYESSRYMLVEMPFRKWERDDLHELYRISATQNITPVLAHVERYTRFGNKVSRLTELNYPIQLNAEAVTMFKYKRKSMYLLNRRSGLVLGSDCHDRLIRAPNLHKAESVIEKRFGKSKLAEIERTENIVLNLSGLNRKV